MKSSKSSFTFKSFEDLKAYSQRMRAGQRDALQRLADDAADLGLDF